MKYRNPFLLLTSLATAVALSTCAIAESAKGVHDTGHCPLTDVIKPLGSEQYATGRDQLRRMSERGVRFSGQVLSVVDLWSPSLSGNVPAATVSPKLDSMFLSELETCAEAGVVGANTLLGTVALVDRSLTKRNASEYFQASSQAKDPLAIAGRAIVLARARNWVAADREWNLALAIGRGVDEYFVGYQYASGQFMSRDYKQAALWFLKADENDDWRAARVLSFMYTTGLGVLKDQAEAERYRKRAEANGSPTEDEGGDEITAETKPHSRQE